MANWYGASRSNYFRVKDIKAFMEDMRTISVAVVINNDAEFGQRCMVHPEDGDDGNWPSYRYDNETDSEMEDIWLPEVISKHLPEGEVAVFLTVGHEKLRYLTGFAVAIDHTGKEIEVNLNEIYPRAAEAFGKIPTAAEY